MRIERLTLNDFGPFAGTHEINLGTGLHMIVGPNGAGKSLLLTAIHYALFGTIPGTTPEQLVHDGATATEMSVQLDLSDGTTIQRGWTTKGKGSGWVRMSGVEDARASDAVKAFVERSGMSAADFRSTVFLGMGDPGPLVTSTASARRDQLGSWVVPAIWGDLAAKASARARELQGQIQRVQATLSNLAPESPGEVEEALTAAERARDEAASRVATPDDVRETERQRQLARSERARRRRLALAVQAEPKIPEPPAEPPPDVSVDRDKLARWRGQHAKTQRLAAGQFDGPCPVDQVECPRAADIRADIDRHRRKADTQAGLIRGLEGQLRAADECVSAHRRACREHEDATREHAAWWNRISDLLDQEGPDVDIVALRREYGDQPNLAAMDREIGALRARLDRARIDTDRVAEMDAELKRLEPELIAWRWMERACGREGVPAMLLDSAVGEIVDEGNRILAEAGATVRFEFRLRKQLKKPADRCRCGYVFRPRKRKCEECDEPRGLQVEHDCEPMIRDASTGDIVRAWRSSGQQAMLAVGLRIGAAAWRMERTGCPWSTLILDEVEGPLSDDNAAACREVVRAAHALGFDQQLMVSHRAASRLAGVKVIRVIPEDGCSKLAIE